MSPKDQASINVGYPILASRFINNKTVLVAGGGGEGNNGIANKVTVIKCSFNVSDATRRLQRFREITLPSNEDSPQCLDITRVSEEDENKYSIVIGCNQSSHLRKTMNINNNLRKYVYNGDEHLRFLDAVQLEPEIKGDVDDYPKIVRLSPGNYVGCMMTSSFPSVIFVFDPNTLELNFKYNPTIDVEIKDFNLSPNDDGKTLCYITSKTIETISTVTGNLITSSLQSKALTEELQGFNLSKVFFLDKSVVLIAATSLKSKAATLLKYSITEKRILFQKVISRKFTMIVALDISLSKDLIAIAGNDLSLTIIKLSTLKVLKSYKKLHPFAITSVAFSPSGTKLATGSAANTFHVIKLSPNISSERSIIGTLFQYLFTIFFIAGFAMLIQYARENGQSDYVLGKSKVYGEIGLAHAKEYGMLLTKYTKQYGHYGLLLLVEYSKLSYEIIKSKVSKENIDGDDNTKKYFKVDEWDDTNASEVHPRKISSLHEAEPETSVTSVSSSVETKVDSLLESLVLTTTTSTAETSDVSDIVEGSDAPEGIESNEGGSSKAENSTVAVLSESLNSSNSMLESVISFDAPRNFQKDYNLEIGFAPNVTSLPDESLEEPTSSTESLNKTVLEGASGPHLTSDEDKTQETEILAKDNSAYTESEYMEASHSRSPVPSDDPRVVLTDKLAEPKIPSSLSNPRGEANDDPTESPLGSQFTLATLDIDSTSEESSASIINASLLSLKESESSLTISGTSPISVSSVPVTTEDNSHIDLLYKNDDASTSSVDASVTELPIYSSITTALSNVSLGSPEVSFSPTFSKADEEFTTTKDDKSSSVISSTSVVGKVNEITLDTSAVTSSNDFNENEPENFKVSSSSIISATSDSITKPDGEAALGDHSTNTFKETSVLVAASKSSIPASSLTSVSSAVSDETESAYNHSASDFMSSTHSVQS